LIITAGRPLRDAAKSAKEAGFKVVIAGNYILNIGQNRAVWYFKMNQGSGGIVVGAVGNETPFSDPFHGRAGFPHLP
jgi:hypothetical protein